MASTSSGGLHLAQYYLHCFVLTESAIMAQRSASLSPSSTRTMSTQTRDSLSTSDVSIDHPTSRVNKDAGLSTHQSPQSKPESASAEETVPSNVQKPPRQGWGIDIHDDPRFMAALRAIHSSDTNKPPVPRRRANVNTPSEQKCECTAPASTPSNTSTLHANHSPESHALAVSECRTNANAIPEQKHERKTAASTPSNMTALYAIHNSESDKPAVLGRRPIDYHAPVLPGSRGNANTTPEQKHESTNAAPTPGKGSLSAGKRQPRRKLQRSHAFMIDRSLSPSGKVLELDAGCNADEDELCALFRNTCG